MKELTAIKDEIMKQEPNERRFIIDALARAVNAAGEDQQEQNDNRPPWEDGPAADNLAGIDDPEDHEGTSEELLKVFLDSIYGLLNKKNKIALNNLAVRLLDQQQGKQNEG